MKKIKLTFTQRDVLLFKALIRNVFPVPNKGDMYISMVDMSAGMDAECFIYLTEDYFNILYNSIIEARDAGKFNSSNAEEHWLGLIDGFESSTNVEDIDYGNLKEWEN